MPGRPRTLRQDDSANKIFGESDEGYSDCASWVAANGPAQAGGQALAVKLDSLDANGRFADRAAFCPPPSSATKDVSPGVTWSRGPDGTRSYALLMIDPAVPVISR